MGLGIQALEPIGKQKAALSSSWLKLLFTRLSWHRQKHALVLALATIQPSYSSVLQSQKIEQGRVYSHQDSLDPADPSW